MSNAQDLSVDCTVCHAPICTGEIIWVQTGNGEIITCPYRLKLNGCPKCGGSKTPGYPACASCAPRTQSIDLSLHPLKYRTWIDRMFDTPLPHKADRPRSFPSTRHDEDCECPPCEDHRRRALVRIDPTLRRVGLTPKGLWEVGEK
jgi:hypothetical protein